ncbi:DNA-processing protein DprA [Cellulomonas edaphi]|uniref:DNA-processing protein DprA n=1 Tax=Cellulomonas edaphi TaxID=3053468 RepID=A0ABT7SCM3_9CELL|nr:DNA-processing protein DprA [Cellulomons edaphi]MDM7832699.1 DNA-processing protein DprA [Cellulomons edaphi]
MSGSPGSGPAPRWAADDEHDERLARAAWSALAEPGDPVAGALVAALGAGASLRLVPLAVRDGLRAAWAAVVGAQPGDLPPPGGVRVERAVERWALRLAQVDPWADLAAAESAGARFLVPGEPGWPSGLDDLGPAAPFGLWVRGGAGGGAGGSTTSGRAGGAGESTSSGWGRDAGGRTDRSEGGCADAGAGLGELLRRSVALVGSRAATTYGERVAVDLAAGLVDAGACVVSGGAYGIDAAAHRGALARGGGTVVLLAGGVDRSYPAGNARLFETVVSSGGALVAEVPPGRLPTKSRFLQRNRLIAAAAGATVVVEAAWRSGAMSTAHHAARLLRPVGAVPGPVTSMASAGCHRLLREGSAVCVTDAAEVMDLAGLVGTDLADEPAAERRRGDGLDPVASRVLEALPRRRGAGTEALAARAGVTLGEARSALGLLELGGLVERDVWGWRLLGS